MLVEHSRYAVFTYDMERLSYDYSLKNIPTPSKTSYHLKLVEQIESVMKRIRWKAYFFLYGDKLTNERDENRKNKFGFKSRNYPSQCPELKKVRSRGNKNCPCDRIQKEERSVPNEIKRRH